MTAKRLTRLVLCLALFAGLVSGLSADDQADRRARPGPDALQSILQEATGLDAEALREALQAGATPAALIETNDGDVAEAIAAAVAQTSSQNDAAMSERLELFSERLSDWLHGETEAGKSRLKTGVGAMLSAVEAATGLDAAQLREAIDSGSTPAELIEAEGGDVDAVIAAAIAQAQTEFEDQRAAQAEQLAQRVSQWFHGEPGKASVRLAIGGSAVQRILEEATGLDAAALREALEGGATASELIEANGGDAEAVMDSLITQAMETHSRVRERMDEMRGRFSEMTGRFKRGFPSPPWKRGPRG